LTEVHESIDISQRDDIDKLKANAVGLGGVLFACLAGAAPITAMLGNVPFAVNAGNGKGIAAAYMFATVTLVVFSVGYVAMARKVTAVGGFYAFISHGLGRVLGVGSGLVGAVAYMSIESALIGGVAYFAQGTLEARLGILVPWPILALITALIIAALSFFDVDVSLKFLGIALACEVGVLLIMDFGILLSGADKTIDAGAGLVATGDGLNTGALSIGNAFKSVPGGAAAIGVFMAFWSWVGFEAAPNYAEESRDPVRNVPRATYISVVALGIFYTFTSWMVVSAWGADETLIPAGALGADFFYLPTTTYAGEFITKLMGWLIITGSLACGMAFHNAATRYWYAMGREGLLPKALGKTHPKYKSAYVASGMQSVLAVILTLVYVIGGQVDGGSAQDYTANAAFFGLYTQMAILATYLLLILQTLVSVGIILYFRKHPEDAHPWKTLVAPAIATIMQLYVIFLLFSNIDSIGGTKGFVPYIAWTGLGILALGMGISLWLRSARPAVYANLGRFVNSGQAD
jgi:amino acid transporter